MQIGILGESPKVNKQLIVKKSSPSASYSQEKITNHTCYGGIETRREGTNRRRRIGQWRYSIFIHRSPNNGASNGDFRLLFHQVSRTLNLNWTLSLSLSQNSYSCVRWLCTV